MDLNVAGWGILDHHLVIAKIRDLKRWTRRKVSMEERYEIKVSELREVTCKIEYEDKFNQRWEMVKGGGGRQEEGREDTRRKGIEWWNEEIRRVVGRKKECF